MILKTTFAVVSLLLVTPLPSAVAMSTTNGVCIKLSKEGTGVRVNVSGSGIVIDGAGGNPGGTQNFNNFSTGNPFASVSDGFSNGVKSLSQSLSVTGFEDNDMSKPYSVELATMNLTTNPSPDKSDITFPGLGSFSIQTGDSFVFSGSALILGLDYDLLNPGTYFASNTSGDAEEFGGVKLNIAAVPVAAVPEPTTLALAVIGGVTMCARRRRPGRQRAAI